MSIQFKKKETLQDSEFCEPNLNLLAHAQAIELDIGSRCGGHGVCGGDRIWIPQEHRPFFSQITSEERTHLSQEELDEGWRLACQCFPNRSDLKTEIQTQFS